jgi:hypothetical protein
MNPPNPIDAKNKIVTKGYYRVVMRPLPRVNERYPDATALKEALMRTEVRIQGWSYPPVMRELLVAVDDYVHAGVSLDGFNEYYRRYQSGQFAHLRGFWEDWGEERKQCWPPQQDKPRFLWLDGVLGNFVGMHRFARNLVEDTKAERLEIDVEMHGTNDRHLEISGSLFGWARGDPTTPNESWRNTWSYEAAELMADADDLGWEAFVHACERLNYDLPRQYPHEWKERRERLK